MSTRRRLRVRKQNRQRQLTVFRLAALGLLSVAIGVTTAVFTATNTVAASRVANKTHTISVPELTPANCTTVTFYRIVGPGGGTIRAEAGHAGDKDQIWLGTSAADNMNGGNGNDCLVPGGVPSGQTESVTGGGGNGTDYCYSGPGAGGYTFNGCENAVHPTGPYTTVASGPF